MARARRNSSTSPFFPSETDAQNAFELPKDASSVAEILISLLHQAGVRRIFGVAGDALNALTDALRRDGRIEWIGFRHEENAAYAACGEAEIGGGLGVCAGTVGPGALHLINGLYNAKREGAPVLAITGQVPMHERGTGYFQEVDLERIFGEVCDFQAVISSPAQMPRLSEIAIQKALGEKIVARLEIPIDLMMRKVPNRSFLHPLVCARRAILPPEAELDRAARLINDSRKITLFCGAGCREARDQVLELSQRIQAPIVNTLRAKDIFDLDEAHVVGMTGLIGIPPAYHAALECDLLVMLGSNFPYESFLPQHVPIIQLDHKIENLGRRAPVSLGLMGTVKETVEALLPRVRPVARSPFLNAILKMKESSVEHLRKQCSPLRNLEPLHPQSLAGALDETASDDAAFTVDVGECTVWAARYLRMRRGRRMLGSFNHGSMGCALPLALGAAAASPGREIWALCGDGSFAMSMQDLVSAVRFGWPIKVLIFNNSELGFVKMENEASGFPLDPHATGLLNPDFAAYARACGAIGIRVEHPHEIMPAIRQARAENSPVVIDAIVTPGALTLPPKIGLKEALGFGASKIKEALLGIHGDHEQWANWKSEFDANLRD